MTKYKRIKKVTYKTVTKVIKVTSGDTIKVPVTEFHVTPFLGPPAIGDVIPATNWAARRLVGLFRACVYAIGPASASPLKIGLAHNVVSRREDLQVGNWVPLTVHRAIFAGARNNALRLERALIDRFETERIPGVRGDWFSIDIEAFDVAIREVVHGNT